MTREMKETILRQDAGHGVLSAETKRGGFDDYGNKNKRKDVRFQVFDGITDIIAAVVIERTHSKAGKARPYVLLTAVAWVLIVMMFSTPGFGVVGKCIYIFITYFLVNSVCLTLANTAETPYLARSLKKSSDATTVMSVSSIASFISSIAASIAIPVMIGMWGAQDNGWTKITLVFAVPCIILTVMRFCMIKEREDLPTASENQQQKFNFADALGVLKKNPHVFALIAAQLLANLYSGMTTTVTVYYFQYVIGDINLQSVAAMTMMISPVAMIFVPILVKKFSSKTVAIAGAIFGVVGNLLRWLGSFNMTLLMIGNAMTGIAVIPTTLIMTQMLIDCMDYNEWKYGERVEGVFGAINAFSAKVGSGLASVVCGFLLGLVHYDGTLAVQSDAANKMIAFMYGGLPAIFFAGIMVAFMCYSIEKLIPQIREELNQRHKAANMATGADVSRG